jgi:hypothetical protein
MAKSKRREIYFDLRPIVEEMGVAKIINQLGKKDVVDQLEVDDILENLTPAKRRELLRRMTAEAKSSK